MLPRLFWSLGRFTLFVIDHYKLYVGHLYVRRAITSRRGLKVTYSEAPRLQMKYVQKSKKKVAEDDEGNRRIKKRSRRRETWVPVVFTRVDRISVYSSSFCSYFSSSSSSSSSSCFSPLCYASNARYAHRDVEESKNRNRYDLAQGLIKSYRVLGNPDDDHGDDGIPGRLYKQQKQTPHGSQRLDYTAAIGRRSFRPG